MTTPAKTQRLSGWRLVLLVAVILSGAVPYLHTLGYPPVWDDTVSVFGNRFLMDCASLGRVLDPASLAGVLPVPGAARPAWMASVILDTCAGGGRLFVYRMTSIYLHALGAGLVLFLAWTLGRSWAVAAAAGLLFAIHPVHTEAVNIIAFRGDLLCLAFMLAALIAYREARGRPGRPGWGLAAASLACFGLALLSKEMAVVLPVLLILTDLLFPLPPGRRRRVLLALYFGLAGAYLVFRAPRSGYVMKSHKDAFSALRDAHGVPFSEKLPGLEPGAVAGNPPQEDPPWGAVYSDPGRRFLTMSRIFGSYLRILAWPQTLQGDYAPKVVDSWRDPGVWAAWAAWLALFAGAWLLRRRVPLASLGLLWIPAALIPVSGIVSILNLQADRYLYAASAGFCLAAAALLDALWRSSSEPSRRAAAGSFMALLAMAAVVRTAVRNADYRSEAAFYEATRDLDPGIPRVRFNLAMVYWEARLDWQAEREFLAALALHPGMTRACSRYADFLVRQGRLEEAVPLLEKARRLSPSDATAASRLGYAYWRAGRRPEAVKSARAAAALAPGYWIAHYNLGVMLLQQGNARGAALELGEALAAARRPMPEVLYSLAMAQRRGGLIGESLRTEAKLRALSPATISALRGPRPKAAEPRYD